MDDGSVVCAHSVEQIYLAREKRGNVSSVNFYQSNVNQCFIATSVYSYDTRGRHRLLILLRMAISHLSVGYKMDSMMTDRGVAK